MAFSSSRSKKTSTESVLNVELSRNFPGALGILEDTSKIVSDLVANKKFFQTTMCEILSSVARSIGVYIPNDEETECIRKHLRFTIDVDSLSNDFMQC
jgi:hypothetical protein